MDQSTIPTTKEELHKTISSIMSNELLSRPHVVRSIIHNVVTTSSIFKDGATFISFSFLYYYAKLNGYKALEDILAKYAKSQDEYFNAFHNYTDLAKNGINKDNYATFTLSQILNLPSDISVSREIEDNILAPFRLLAANKPFNDNVMIDDLALIASFSKLIGAYVSKDDDGFRTIYEANPYLKDVTLYQFNDYGKSLLTSTMRNGLLDLPSFIEEFKQSMRTDDQTLTDEEIETETQLQVENQRVIDILVFYEILYALIKHPAISNMLQNPNDECNILSTCVAFDNIYYNKDVSDEIKATIFVIHKLNTMVINMCQTIGIATGPLVNTLIEEAFNSAPDDTYEIVMNRFIEKSMDRLTELSKIIQKPENIVASQPSSSNNENNPFI